ncbi:hypothetical protein BW28_05785 [Clostridioides difficile]|nr:hypothetical protein BW28_05785 [Clostridioides difficile]
MPLFCPPVFKKVFQTSVFQCCDVVDLLRECFPVKIIHAENVGGNLTDVEIRQVLPVAFRPDLVLAGASPVNVLSVSAVSVVNVSAAGAPNHPGELIRGCGLVPVAPQLERLICLDRAVLQMKVNTAGGLNHHAVDRFCEVILVKGFLPHDPAEDVPDL